MAFSSLLTYLLHAQILCLLPNYDNEDNRNYDNDINNKAYTGNLIIRGNGEKVMDNQKPCIKQNQ
jgi:hypothetical protein